MKFSNPGDRFKPIYEPVVAKDGSISVVQTGSEDLQEYIQSFSESCDVETIVAKSVYDPSLLNKRDGGYGDFTKLPKTYAEMLQKMIDAEALFAKLPPDRRAFFNNDVFKFISSMDDKDWLFNSGLAVRPVEEKSNAPSGGEVVDEQKR